LRSYIVLAALAACSFASANFFDNFNRADGGLGGNYTTVVAPSPVISANMAAGSGGANGLTVVNTGAFSGSYDTTTVSAIVSLSDSTTTLAYTALALGSDGTGTASHGIFVKVQRQSTGNFDFLGAYTGAGTNTTAIALNGGNFQALQSTFSRARLTVKTTSLTNLYIGIDTNFDNTDDQVYTGTLNFPTLVVGNQVGLHIFGTTGRIDDFSATTVPEPATIAALGLGVAALLRRRRK
jgi:hypothetical protein